ncbi:MAG: hypothetical protein QHH43_09395 [Candidatus Saccharicenans sp.]|jgi:hypothetical protein|nr:hypothetical protein [Candidatus Saccharicenans sp.]MDH7575956.1 hypothetical protein [Candidatus Saccharicenans sp.]
MNLKTLLWIGLVAGLLLGLDRLLLYMEGRGWIYYRRKKPSSSALSNACLEVQQLLEPSKKYVVQIKKDERRDQQEAGDLPPEEQG